MTGNTYSGPSQVTVSCGQLRLTFCENTHAFITLFSVLFVAELPHRILYGGQTKQQGIFHPSSVAWCVLGQEEFTSVVL